MNWKLKNKYKDLKLDSCAKPFSEFTQKEIANLRQHFRDKYFQQISVKKEKKDVGVEG